MNKKVLLILLFIVSFSWSTIASAAVLNVAVQKNASFGERIAVDITIDPETKSINSIESTVLYDPTLLTFNGFGSTQGSIAIWVKEPTEIAKGTIEFSGVIPGGIERLYDPLNTARTAIPVVRLFFIAQKSGIAEFSLKNALVLENNGKGTSVPVSLVGARTTILKGEGPLVVEHQDIVPPEPFTISIIDRSLFGRTPRLVAFSTEDTDTGVSRYEVAIGAASFHPAKSPYVLPYRLFSYTFTVRAYDYEENVREQTVTIPGEKPYGIGIFLGIAVVAFFLYRFYTTRSKS